MFTARHSTVSWATNSSGSKAAESVFFSAERAGPYSGSSRPSRNSTIFFLPFLSLNLILLYLGAKAPKDALIAVGILLLAYFLTYAIAYRFTRFAVVSNVDKTKREE